MPVLSTQNLTLADWAKRLDPDGKVGVVAELLSQKNPILDDAVFMEANGPTHHRIQVRTGLPQAYWRALGVGVPASKSTTAQVDEGIGMLEAWSRVDKDLATLNGSLGSLRASEDAAFIESLNQQMAQTLIYGSAQSNAASFSGFAVRYGALSGAGNSQNILDAGGTSTNNASIWLINWGADTVFCTFPKGSQAGLLHEDHGEVNSFDASGNAFRVFETRYQWKNGLVVKDWRHVVRVANINVSNLTSNTNPADLIALMSRSLDRLPDTHGRPSFYMNRTLYSFLRLQALNKSNNAVTVETALNQFGTSTKELSFGGVPIKRVDQLMNTEARVV